ncbi:MAG: Stk1 family PASTA domain-containing Ser/Thr kinase [Ferrimicrobium sp.]
MTDAPQQAQYGARYQPNRKIARGGMADVFEAHDLLLDRSVALKVLFSELSTNATFVERFRREAQAAAALAHPNIVSVYDWGPANGTYYIVMELITGTTLAEVIRESGQVQSGRAAAIGADVALALAFAHRHGVVHRDIKPSNVLIADDGSVKVADFGIARAVTNDEDLTQTGAVLGTATYISPEQAKGDDLDGRSDLYSLGVVLYEMVTGVPPFVGESPIAVAYKHVTEAVRPPRQLNPLVPAGLEAIIMRCLQKDRSRRYADAGELRADLVRLLDDRPVRTEMLVVGGIGDTTVMGAERTQFISTVPPTSSIPIVTVPPDSPSRSRWWLWTLIVLLLLGLIAALVVPKLLNTAAKKPAVAAQVRVPSVVGAGEQGAQSTLTADGFQVNTNFVSNVAAIGTVVSQNPKGQTLAKKGSIVTLTISNGRGTVIVPSVLKEQVTNAEAKLLALGFNVSTNYQAASAAQGTVINQSPQASQSVQRGSTVVLTVSNGPATIAVPNVVGAQLAQASNKLGSDQLAVGNVTYQPSASQASGVVLSTSPVAGTQVAPNSAVNLVVSSGSATTTTTTTSSTTTSTVPIPPS